MLAIVWRCSFFPQNVPTLRYEALLCCLQEFSHRGSWTSQGKHTRPRSGLYVTNHHQVRSFYFAMDFQQPGGPAPQLCLGIVPIAAGARAAIGDHRSPIGDRRSPIGRSQIARSQVARSQVTRSQICRPHLPSIRAGYEQGVLKWTPPPPGVEVCFFSQ